MTHATATLKSDQLIAAVEQEMRAVLHFPARHSDPFYGMLHYHMGWLDQAFNATAGKPGGKRIRPLLCLLTCAAAGGAWQQAVPAGAAIELLHNFSLIHDDIEDRSPLRRGRATLWRVWGEAQAINSGDAMFALAHLALARLSDHNVAAEVVVQALRRFDEMCVGLTTGQYHDMRFETLDTVSVADYVGMIEGKTAVLLAYAAETGALIAGASDETQAQYAQFGRKLGIAFQILDDILGVWGDEALIGKSAESDILTRKKTLPVLFGLEQSADLRALYASDTTPDADFVATAVALLEASGAREFAMDQATSYSTAALDHLEAAAPTGSAGAALTALAARLLNRQT